MTATLATLRDRVEQIINDTGNTTFSTGEVDEGIRQALDIYSKFRPYQAISTLTLSADGREIDISSITDLLNINRVWLPYTAATPEYPPRWRSFEHWQDAQVLYVTDDVEGTYNDPLGTGAPSSGQVARIFYTKKQLLNGLDSATSTTFADDDETIIAIGASGYTVMARSREAQETVMLDDQVPISKEIREWAKGQIKQFVDVMSGGGPFGMDDYKPARVTVKRLTRRTYYDSGWPPSQEQIPT